MNIMNNYKPLTIVIAEAALETIPPILQSHPIILKHARKRRKPPHEILLDISIHYPAMKEKLSEFYKRGRPDLIHITLLNILESPANRKGLVRVYIHTINDIVVFVNPKIRLPKNYNRFVGLMEQLFKEGKVPPDSEHPLMMLKNLNLKDLLNKISIKEPILLSEKGKRIRLRDIVRCIIKDDSPVIIGGFQHGDFNERTYGLTDKIYSIYEESLPAWIVASRLITLYEDELNVI